MMVKLSGEIILFIIILLCYILGRQQIKSSEKVFSLISASPNLMFRWLFTGCFLASSRRLGRHKVFRAFISRVNLIMNKLMNQ